MQPAPESDGRSGDLLVVLAADPVSIRDGLAKMMAKPPLVGLCPDDRGTAELVLAEILNNVAEHAYADFAGTVSISLAPVQDGIKCLIVDQGVPMPAGRLPEGKLVGWTDTALDDLPEGGFGWNLIRTLTLGLSYSHTDGCNRLQFTLPNSTQSA